MERSSRGSIWIFLATFVLVIYGMGAAVIESFVNYPTWKLIGPDEFTTYHNAISPLIIGFLVVPMVVATFLTGLSLWFRPPGIPPWALWTAFGLQVFVWISTVTIQIPIQIQLSSTGLSLPAIDRLIVTNFWLRRIPYTINVGLFIWMMSRLLKLHDSRLATEDEVT